MTQVQERIRAALAALRPVNYLRVLPWLPRASKPLTGLICLLTLVAAALPAAFIALSGALIGTVPEAIAGGLSSPAGHRFTTLLVLLGVVLTAQQVAGPVMSLVTSALSDRVTLNASDEVMQHCLAPAGIAHLEDPATLNSVATARGVGSLGWGPGAAAAALVTGTTRKLGALGSIAMLARFHVLFPVALLALWLWLRRGNRSGMVKVMQAQIGNVQPHRLATYYRHLSYEPDAAKETRLFDLGAWVRGRFTGHWNDAMDQLREARRGGVKAIGSLSLVYGASHFAGVGVLIWAASAGRISLGEFATFAQAVVISSLPIAGIYDDDYVLEYASASIPAADSLRQIASDGAVAGGGRAATGLPARSISFEGVAFSYPGTDTRVFDGLDLEIPAGRSLAIVGVNGAGKTTLIKLLARMYDPQEGSVRVDGIDLRELDARHWQQQVGAIFQDFVRYELPARANVGFGAREHMSDTAALEEVIARAGAVEVVEGLPGGWDTTLSAAYSGGRELSGGEWQKIALARALFAVRGGAQVLVLDEPTANLDVRSEAELFQRFLDVTAGVTTILVSHRFSTVRHADQICVVEGGRVVELGDHRALMATGGRYAEMFNLQAARFEDVVAGSEG